MPVATWPGTGYGPVVQIGYTPAEVGCEFQWDCAVWGGEIPEPEPTADVFEPFDDFTTNGWFLNGPPTIAAGRTGMACRVGGATQYAAYNIAALDQSDTVTVGFAHMMLDASAGDRTLVELRGDAGATYHVGIRTTATGSVSARRAGATLLGTATAAGVLTRYVWSYVEVQAKLGDVDGFVIVHVDGVEVINTGPVDTRNAGTATTFDQVRLCPVLAATVGMYDDLYMTWGAGAAFLGDTPVAPSSTVAILETVVANLGSSPSPSITFSGAPAEGDLVVLMPSDTVHTTAIAPPAGWVNPLGGIVAARSDANAMACVHHLVTAGDAAAGTQTFTATNLWAASANGSTIGLLVRNTNPADPVDAAASASDAAAVTPHVLPALPGASLGTGSLVVGCIAKDGTGSYTAPAGWTSIATSNNLSARMAVRRDTLTMSGVDVTATNITPDTADEYASVTLAFTQKAGATTRLPVEDPGRWGPWWDWRNVECDVRAGSNIVRGTASPGQRASSSTASLTLSPRDNTLAPWYVDPATGERPNRANLPIRIGVTHHVSGDEWWLFTGWIDYITEVDSPDELSLTVVASDGFKALANLDQAEQAAQGAGEAAGSRIGRILDHANWAAGRNLSPGTFALQATTLARPALEEIFLTADTEGGLVWVDVHGAFRFVDRDWLRTKAERTDWRLGDRQVDPTAICLASIVTTADDMDIENVIGISRVGGTAQWVEDPDSIAKYGRHSWSRTDLPYANDSDTATILAFQLADRTARDFHAQAVVLAPLTEADAWPCVVAVELYDTVHLTRARGGDVRAELAGVIGIDHSFGPNEFVTVLSLGPRIRQTLSRWDVDRWDSARWSAS